MAIGDMFLKVETARTGVVKGEAGDLKHKGEIDVLSWSWAMSSRSAMAAAGPSSRATLDELRVVKKIDMASTALMSSMRSNELIRKVLLTVRKAGSDPLEYLKIALENARITHIGLDTENTEVVERVNFAFQRITVDYTPQGNEGASRGATSFSADTHTPA
ncbi:MAG TPA: type VI secretion system tube protein Hcp [Burkholderiales bacterium]|nr:type VI secretion system tube protein Hcp [Burkholderiales bacterium]